MKIGSYSLSMLSRHELNTSRSFIQRSRIQTGSPSKSNVPVKMEISAQAAQLLRQERNRAAISNSSQKSSFSLDKYVSSRTLMQKSLIERLLSALLGKKVQIKLFPDDSDGADGATTGETAGTSQFQISLNPAGLPQPNASPVIQTETTETYQEMEQLSFAAAGSVRTADGREIQFSTQFDLSREFITTSTTQSVAKMTDPLVINYGDGNTPTAAQLTNQKFNFDLNGDGKQEQISFVTPGSGFLALDRNRDGQVNDGKELFGPSNGNGFDELQSYDQDHNGWIDENDAVFSELKIWSKDAAGKDLLFSLADKGVGAIYLGNVKAEFSLKSGENVNGVSRNAGFFLKEDGTAGTIQQIDLVV